MEAPSPHLLSGRWFHNRAPVLSSPQNFCRGWWVASRAARKQLGSWCWDFPHDVHQLSLVRGSIIVFYPNTAVDPIWPKNVTNLQPHKVVSGGPFSWYVLNIQHATVYTTSTQWLTLQASIFCLFRCTQVPRFLESWYIGGLVICRDQKQEILPKYVVGSCTSMTPTQFWQGFLA